MDDHILDLDNLTTLLTGVLQQVDRPTLEQVAAVMEKSILEKMILEAIGVARERLSPEEEERFAEMVESVLHTVLYSTGGPSGNPQKTDF